MPATDLTHPIRNQHIAQLQAYLGRRETTADHAQALRLTTLRQARDYLVAQIKTARPDDYDTRRTSEMEHCATQWWVDHDGNTHGLHTRKCRLRECPICAKARLGKWYLRLRSSLQVWSAPKHLVLTLKRSDDPLNLQVHRLISSWRKLRQTKLWRSRTPWGIAVVEIKYHPTDRSWHPHLHIVGNLAYLPFAELRAAWQTATGDSSHVWIESVKGDIAGYLALYMAKGLQAYLTYPDPAYLATQLKGLRTINAFGTWPISHHLPKRPWKSIQPLYTLLRAAMLGDLRSVILCKRLMPEYPTAFRETAALFRPETDLHRGKPLSAGTTQ